LRAPPGSPPGGELRPLKAAPRLPCFMRLRRSGLAGVAGVRRGRALAHGTAPWCGQHAQVVALPW